MSNEMTISFNGENYLAQYNKQTGYYEVDLSAPTAGGIHEANIEFTDLLGQSYTDKKVVQVLAKQKLKIKSNKVFMWIFDYKDFTVKDIIEIADYEINIDEETNASSTVKVLKKTTAKTDDIVAIKKAGETIFWGTIKEIQNDNGKRVYDYILKYITNIFDTKVALKRNVEVDTIEDGTYIIKSALDTKKVLDVTNASMANEANIELWSDNGSDWQKWKIEKQTDNYYSIKSIKSGKCLDIAFTKYADGTNVQQYEYNGGSGQKWGIEHRGGAHYKIFSKGNNTYCLDVHGGNTQDGTNIEIYQNNGNNTQRFYLEKQEEYVIRENGVEDFIAEAINKKFVNNKDTFLNRQYLEIRVKTHTKLQTSVTNVQDNVYNLHTWMANCTQLHNINFNFFIENKKLIIEIENKQLKKELIDINAQAISDYTEVFTTDVVSKVEVLTSKETYYLYMLNDRTTTIDATNTNRASGKTETVYVEKYEEAPQKALDVIKSNSYNHNVTFKMLNKYMKVGTPIAIKTKESIILDTYISALKITQKNFVEYTCGNIRIKFIDKLLKERK